MALRTGAVGGTVIIAEDDGDTRELYEQYFSEEGFTVHVASNGAAAVELAGAYKIDAFVTDLQMPVMDGWEAVRRVRALVGPRPYILVVSAHVNTSDVRSEAYVAGADDVVSKPISARVVVTIVRVAMRDRLA